MGLVEPGWKSGPCVGSVMVAFPEVMLWNGLCLRMGGQVPSEPVALAVLIARRLASLSGWQGRLCLVSPEPFVTRVGIG